MNYEQTGKAEPGRGGREAGRWVSTAPLRWGSAETDRPMASNTYISFYSYCYFYVCMYVFLFNPQLRTCLLILEREEGWGEDRNFDLRNIDRLPPAHTLTGDGPRNLGMRPDRASNPKTFSAQEAAPVN